MGGVDGVVRHPVSATLTSGTQHFNVFQNVRLTVDISERSLDTSADPHSTVQRLFDEDHVATLAGDVQKLSVAHFKDARICRCRHSKSSKSRMCPYSGADSQQWLFTQARRKADYWG